MLNNKRKKHLLLIAGGIFALFVLAMIKWVCIVFLSRPSYLVPDTADWKTGDIFFSVGDSWESVAVRSLSGIKNFEVSDSTPSHCGIVVRDSVGVRLIHASTVAKKIVSETPDEYLKNNGSYCLYARRFYPLPDTVAIRETLDSLLISEVPFDFNFDHSESQSLYCSEMVVRVFELNDIDCFLILKEQSYIYPEDILKILK